MHKWLNIKKLLFLKKYWREAVIMLLSVAFFLVAASYNYQAQKDGFIKWSSPDETANYVLTKLYAQTGQLQIFEKYNLLANGIIHPRSLRSDSGWLKPMSFLGLVIIYGKIASIFSYKIIPYLTPFFASLGIFFFYLLIKKLFGGKNAFISAWLLACFPAYFHYTAHSMFHNVLFVVLIILGLYFALLIPPAKTNNTEVSAGEQLNLDEVSRKTKKSQYLTVDWLNLFFSALSGTAFGLAIITRTSELLWLAPILSLLWLFNIKKTSPTKLIVFLAFMFFALTPALSWNKILYGSYWRGGYPEMNQSLSNIKQAAAGLTGAVTLKSGHNRQWINLIKSSIFYFGIYPRFSLRMFYYYFIKMFYWLFWPALSGLIIFLIRWRKWRFKHLIYLICYLVTSAVLMFYYGSWNFHDNPNAASFTIGNSYTRYWLPIYLGAMPFASMFIIKFSGVFKKKNLIYLFRFLILAVIVAISISLSWRGSEESAVSSLSKQLASRREYEQILKLTENRSVIITKYHDKLLFPDRKVIVGVFNDMNMNRLYARLAKILPIYYYNFTLPAKDLDYLNNKRLAEAGLKISEVTPINQIFTLYKLTDVQIKVQQ